MRHRLRLVRAANQTDDTTQHNNGTRGMTTLPHLHSASPAGMVWLIGAGPGDPELMTVKAQRVLTTCTIWLVDDLVGPGVLALASPATQVIKVGKRGGCPSTSQSF